MLASGSVLQTNRLTSYSRKTAGIVVCLLASMQGAWSLEAPWFQISKAFLSLEGIRSLSSTAKPYLNHHHPTLRRTYTVLWIMLTIIS